MRKHKYKVMRVSTTKVLFRVMERRKLPNGKLIWVCIAIGTGQANSASLVNKLNRALKS